MGREQIELPESVPFPIRSIVADCGGITVPKEESPAEREVFDRAREGRCMTCGAELGEHTMIVVTHSNVVMLYCSGMCYTDMQVLGFIQEVHEDVVQRIKWRGSGDGDGPEQGS